MFGGNLVAHQADGVGARADKHKTRTFHLLGKIGIFRQKAIARMNGIRTGYFRRRNQRGNVQITLRGRCGTDAHGFVRQLDVQALAVGLGMHGNGGNTQLAAGAQHA